MGLLGNYKVNQDSKGRIVLPQPFRKIMETKIVISLEFENMVVIRNETEFEKWSSYLMEKNNLDRNVRYLQRMVLGNSVILELDEKGRFLIPKSLSSQAKLTDSLQFIGLGNRIEIMSSYRWKALNNSKKNEILLEESAKAIEKLGK